MKFRNFLSSINGCFFFKQRQNLHLSRSGILRLHCFDENAKIDQNMKCFWIKKTLKDSKKCRKYDDLVPSAGDVEDAARDADGSGADDLNYW